MKCSKELYDDLEKRYLDKVMKLASARIYIENGGADVEAIKGFLNGREPRQTTNPATLAVIEANKLAAASFYDFEDRSV
jgi:hypothetical protein